jgi:hypothetical protein
MVNCSFLFEPHQSFGAGFYDEYCPGCPVLFQFIRYAVFGDQVVDLITMIALIVHKNGSDMGIEFLARSTE